MTSTQQDDKSRKKEVEKVGSGAPLGGIREPQLKLKVETPGWIFYFHIL